MARIWKWSVVVFLIIGLCCHQEEAMMNALMDTPYMVWDLFFNVILSACLWGGFLNVIQNKVIYTYLSSNILANLLGLGTLATISGVKAFQKLQELNHHSKCPSRPMLTLVIINTAGLSLFPSTLLMIRQQMGSQDIYAFYPYMLLIGITIIMIGLIMQRVIDHE